MDILRFIYLIFSKWTFQLSVVLTFMSHVNSLLHASEWVRTPFCLRVNLLGMCMFAFASCCQIVPSQGCSSKLSHQKHRRQTIPPQTKTFKPVLTRNIYILSQNMYTVLSHLSFTPVINFAKLSFEGKIQFLFHRVWILLLN